MVAEREVVIKLGVQGLRGGDDPLKKMAASAKSADVDVKKLTGSTKSGFDGITRSVALSEQAMRKFADSIRKAEEAQKKLNSTKSAGGAGGGGGMFGGGGVGKLAGFGFAVEGLEKAVRVGDDIGNLAEAMKGNLENVDLSVGLLGPIAEKMVKTFDKIAGALGKDPFNTRRAAGDEAKVQAVAGAAGNSLAKLQAQAAFREEQRFGQGALGAIGERRSQARIQLEARARGMSGDDEQNFTLEQMRRLARSGVNESEERFAGIRKQEQVMAFDPVTQGQNKAKFAIERAEELDRMIGAQEKLIAVEERQLEVIKQQGAMRQDALRQQVALYDQEEKKLKAIADQERSRLNGLKADFGFLDPTKQRAVRDLAGKIAGGGKLNEAEIEFARGQQGLFGGKLKEIGQQRGGAAGFDQIARQLGLDAEMRRAETDAKKTAELKMQIEQKLSVEIKQNEQAVGDQLAKQLIPAIQRQNDLMEQRIREEMDKREGIAFLNRVGAIGAK